MGLTFKENVPDIRNTKVIDVIRELEDYDIEVMVNDPVADPDLAREEYGLELSSLDAGNGFDAIILAVSHDAYKSISLAALKNMYKSDETHPVLVDVKGCINPEEAVKEGFMYWSL
jgi:UDP-N-acetyl-D-galactosamine dehydrogenase